MSEQPRKFLNMQITEESIIQAFQSVLQDSTCAVTDYRFELLREDRYDEAYKFLAEYLPTDEPCSKSLGVTWAEQLKDDYIRYFREYLTIAIISADSSLVGLRVIHILKRDDNITPEKYTFEPIRKRLQFMKYKSNYFDIFAHYNVDEVFYLHGLAIHREHRGKGLGSKIMQASLVFIRNLIPGTAVVTGECSSNHSKRIYEKLEFDSLAEIMFEDYKVAGEIVMDNTGEHKSMKVYGKIV